MDKKLMIGGISAIVIIVIIIIIIIVVVLVKRSSSSAMTEETTVTGTESTPQVSISQGIGLKGHNAKYVKNLATLEDAKAYFMQTDYPSADYNSTSPGTLMLQNVKSGDSGIEMIAQPDNMYYMEKM